MAAPVRLLERALVGVLHVLEEEVVGVALCGRVQDSVGKGEGVAVWVESSSLVAEGVRVPGPVAVSVGYSHSEDEAVCEAEALGLALREAVVVRWTENVLVGALDWEAEAGILQEYVPVFVREAVAVVDWCSWAVRVLVGRAEAVRVAVRCTECVWEGLLESERVLWGDSERVVLRVAARLCVWVRVSVGTRGAVRVTVAETVSETVGVSEGV